MEEIKTYEQKLKEQEEKYTALSEKIDNIRGDVLVNEDYEKYQELEDSEKEKQYPDIYNALQQKKELEAEKDMLDESKQAIATELFGYIVKEIAAKEKQLAEYENNIKETKDNITKIQVQIENLKASEAYQKGDPTAIEEVEKLEKELEEAKTNIAKWETEITGIKSQLEALMAKKENIMDEYGIYEQVQSKEEVPTEENVSKTLKESIEQKLQANRDTLAVVKKEISFLNKDIKKLKESEEYKSGDLATIEKVNNLESELAVKKGVRAKITSRIKEYETQLSAMEQEENQKNDVSEKEELAAEKETVSEEQTEKVEETVKPEEEKQEQEAREEKKPNDKREKNSKPRTVVYSNPVPAVEIDEEEKMKEDYEKIYVAAKMGTLTSKQFDRLAEILKDPDNYKKLNITTGIVFNKGKMLFNSMVRAANVSGYTIKSDDDALDEKIREARVIVARDRDSLSEDEQLEWDKAQTRIKQYEALKKTKKVYNEVAKTRRQERWSWLFTFEEDQKEALPEATKSKDITEELSNKVVGDSEYTAPETEKKEPTKEEVTVDENRGSNWWI